MTPLPPFSQARRIAAPAALALGAAVLLIPANVLPVMHMATAGEAAYDATIFSGVALLCREGLWGLGAIVFTASILVPLLKLVGLTRLLWAVRSGSVSNPRSLTRLYGMLEFIGRWSMLDVFLVAFLSGAVRFGHLAQVAPRRGIVAFAGAVVLTILATRTFDPQLLWTNKSAESEPSKSP